MAFKLFAVEKEQPKPEPRSWDAIRALLDQIIPLADQRLNRREFYMWVDERGCRIVIERTGSKYEGFGSTPWEAATDLRDKCVNLSREMTTIINGAP